MKPEVAPPNLAADERLESWKEIAAFLGKGVRTVQRWERTEDLPVRRHLHERGGTVYAYKAEVLEWYRMRQSRLAGEPASDDHAAPAPLALQARFSYTRLLAMVLGASIVLVTLLVVTLRPASPRLFTGSTTALLSVVGRASQAVPSPGGDRIAFVWNGERDFGNLDIYMKPVGGGLPVRLTDHANNEHSPSWSADGHSLVFLRDRDGVFLLRLGDKSQPTRVFPQSPGAVYGVGSSWSRDGRFLFYSEFSGPGAPLEIFRLDVRAGTVERIIKPLEGHGDMYPCLSPDGRWIAFVRRASSLAAHVYVLQLGEDGRPRGTPQRITTEATRIAGLDWLPGSAGLVFSSDYSGTRRLWTVRRNWWGSSRPAEPLALAGEDAFQPRVAESIPALVFSRRFWPVAIWRLNLDRKSAETPLVKLAASSREDMEPAWSPEGDRIAFVSTRSGHTEIWVCRADGTRGVQLTRFGGPMTHSPAWSPDGSTIAFHSGPEQASSVFVIPASGGTPRQLTPPGMHSVEPSWSRDGGQVYFASTQSGIRRIWRIPVRGGTPAAVTTGPAAQPKVSPDGVWLYFRRGGIWRMPVTGGPEREIVPGPVGTFALAQDRIYFDRGFGDYAPPELHVHDLRANRTKLVTRFERRKTAGLSVSSDGHSVLVPLNDRQSSEILLVR